MSSDKSPSATGKLDRILAEAQRSREEGYRDKALKMYPHVCGRCAREFSGKRLSELTVHHPRPQPRQQPARRFQLGAAVPVLP